MAFTTKTKQSVEIDGVAYIPNVTTELRLRLSGDEMKFDTEEASARAYNVIAECFGDKKEEVRALLPKISTFDLQLMRAYLLGGDRAVKIIEDEFARSMGAGNE